MQSEATLIDRRTALVDAQDTTLSQPRMPTGLGAKSLFGVMDLLYGKAGSLAKFRVLEVVARVPYIAWEQVSYVAITHTHSTPRFARQIHQEVRQCREQQDNELFHLLILEELLQQRGERQGLLRYRVVPQILAWAYYHLSWALYVLRPKLSYQLNAQFEDHAEHEYMEFVAAHPELEDEPWRSEFRNDYGHQENGSLDSVADLLRHIAVDERHHKEESLQQVKSARFGNRRLA